MNRNELSIKLRPSKVTISRIGSRFRPKGHPCTWRIEALKKNAVDRPPSDDPSKYPRRLESMVNSSGLARRYNPFEFNGMLASYLKRAGIFTPPYGAKLPYLGVYKLDLL